MVFVIEGFDDSLNPCARLFGLSLTKQFIGYLPIDGAGEQFGFLHQPLIFIIHC